MYFKKSFYKLLLCFIFIFGLIVYISFSKLNTQAIIDNAEEILNFSNDAKSSILLECKTNTVLFRKNDNEQLAPASMTKIMTMLLVMEKIDQNLINYNDVVTTPKEASSLGGSQIYLSEGEKMTVHDLLKGMCIASANDAAMSLACYVGGNEKNFVNMMNNKVKDLGLSNTHFVNPYGFDDPNHYSSSYDMAIIASELINKHPKILEYTSLYEDYVREDTEKRFWLVNTNKLVKFVEGVDGLKTGWTNNSGYCLTATISKNNERFLVVNMGNSSPTIRNKEVTELLQYAITNYETKKIVSKGDVIKEINDITKMPKNIKLKASNDVTIVKMKKDKLKAIAIKEYIDLDNNNYYIDVYYDNLLYNRVPLVTDDEIKNTNVWILFIEIIRSVFLS